VDFKVYDRFQRLGVTLGYSASLAMLKRVGNHFEDKIVGEIFYFAFFNCQRLNAMNLLLR